MLLALNGEKIRAIIDDKGKNLKQLNPSAPAEILGLNDVPVAGDEIIVVESESRAREVSEYRTSVILKERTNLSRANSMENILKSIKSGEKKLLNIVLKQKKVHFTMILTSVTPTRFGRAIHFHPRSRKQFEVNLSL